MHNDPITVLLAEDDPTYAGLLREILSDASAGKIHCERVERLSEALAILSQQHFDVLLLDLGLPDKNGLDTFLEVKRHAPQLPVVVLTGTDDEKLALDAMREGGQDYLVKGQFDGRLIARILRYAIERKRLTETLREREEFFRLISDNMTDLVAVLDLNGKRLYNSPSYKNLLGDPKQLIGTNSFEDVHPDDRPLLEKVFRDTFSTGVGQRAEYRLIVRDGGIRNVESIGSVVRTDDGQPAKLVVVSRDITERKRAEEALRESERRYKRLIDSTTDYIFTVVIDNGQVVATTHGPGCQAVTGYSSAEYRLDPFLWYKMVYEEDRQRVLEQAQNSISGGSVTPIEHRIIHKDGSIRWVKNTPVLRKDDQGRVVSYDGLISDITDRKKAEERLRSSETLYQSLVESLPQCVFRKNPDGRYTFGNQRFCDWVGKSWAEISGKSDFDLFPIPLAQRFHDDDCRVRESGQIFGFEEESVRADGKPCFIHIVKIPIQDQVGKPAGIQGIFWDVTEEMESEAALKKTLADLKKSHEALKAAQLQLIQAEKMDSIGTLAAGVAHEVKNPLQIILMGVSFLSHNISPMSDNMSLVLNDMTNAVKRADLVVRGLMDFATPNQLEVKEQDLNQVIEQSLALIKYEINRRNARIIKSLAPTLTPFVLDQNKIKQVFVNLFINAMQAMGKGGTLTIETKEQRLVVPPQYMTERSTNHFKAGDLVVVVEVRDTGPGIPEEKLTKLFDPFFTTKSPGEGTGLGLTVVKRIIDLHGASIDIRNHPEGGTRVLLMFNTSRKPDNAVTVAASSENES